MTKNRLEETIAHAANKFALEVIKAVKASSLQELMALQGGVELVEKVESQHKLEKEPKARKKRVVTNYPKCAFAGCDKNRFPRGKGYCGDHWKQHLAGEIPAANA